MCGGGNLPGGPVVKTLPSNAGVQVQSGGGARIMPLGPKTKTSKQKQYCNIFNKDLK